MAGRAGGMTYGSGGRTEIGVFVDDVVMEEGNGAWNHGSE